MRSKNGSIFRAQNATAFWALYRNLILRSDFRSHFEAAIWAQNLTVKSTPSLQFRLQSELQFRALGAIRALEEGCPNPALDPPPNETQHLDSNEAGAHAPRRICHPLGATL